MVLVRFLKMKLQGIFAPIATPFDHNGNIYEAKLRHNIEKWNRTGLAGYMACGATGEGVMLASDEKRRIWKMVAEVAGSDKLLIAATGMESVRETVCLTNHAATLGYGAAAVAAPCFYKAQVNQLLYFRTVADRSRIPIIIDDRANIKSEAVAALSEHPNIVAVKVIRRVREAQSTFPVLAGSASTLWPSLLAGASGAILPLANAVPYATIAVWEAFRTREEEAGADLQSRIAAAALASTRYGVPGLKHAMDLNGYYGGPPRLPLAVPSPEARAEIEEAFRDLRG
jgi:4-hydroxy-2-oxoglutarate aldolase